MRAVSPRTIARIAIVVASAAALGWFLVNLRVTGDYTRTLPGSDNADPPLTALVHLRFAHLLAVQTVMGLTSLLWRAPFVAPVILSGGTTLEAYAVGAAACTLPVVGLVAWLVTREFSVHQIAAAGIAALLMILSAPTINAIEFGHPEEILTTVLAVAAVIAAKADRRATAALLLGLAVGAKEWAVLTAPAVLIALPEGRRRATGIALGVACLTTAPLPLLDLAAFQRADSTVGAIHGISALSLWWPVRLLSGPNLPLGLNRGVAAFGSIVVVLLLLRPVGHLLRSRIAEQDAVRLEPMAMLALIGLLRCVCDPGGFLYYLVAAVIPITVWEVGELRRLPVVATVLCGLISLCFTGSAPLGATPPELGGTAGINLFLAASVLLVIYLLVRTLVPPGLRANLTANESARRHEPLRST